MTDHITFFKSYLDAVKDLPAEIYKEIMNAALIYAFYGTEPENLSSIAAGFFTLMRPNIDASLSKSRSGQNGGKKSGEVRDPKQTGSKDEADAKQIGSNSEASVKQTRSKDEANTKQTGSKDEADAKQLGIGVGEGKGEGVGTGDINTNSSERSKIAHEPEADVEAIPLNDGTEWRPTQKQYEEYVRLYPAVNVQSEFRGMRGWCLSNPSKRKTRRGVERFVTGWLERCQNRGGNNRAAPQGGQGMSADDYLQSIIRGEA